MPPVSPQPAMRLSDLARQLFVSEKELVERGREIGLLLSTMSRLDDAQVGRLRALYAPPERKAEDGEGAIRKGIERFRGGRVRAPGDEAAVEAAPVETPAEPDGPRVEGEILAYVKPEAVVGPKKREGVRQRPRVVDVKKR